MFYTLVFLVRFILYYVLVSFLLKFCAYQIIEAMIMDTGYADCNKEENILSWERLLKPRIYFGVSLDKIIVGESSGQTVMFLTI